MILITVEHCDRHKSYGIPSEPEVSDSTLNNQIASLTASCTSFQHEYPLLLRSDRSSIAPTAPRCERTTNTLLCVGIRYRSNILEGSTIIVGISCAQRVEEEPQAASRVEAASSSRREADRDINNLSQVRSGTIIIRVFGNGRRENFRAKATVNCHGRRGSCRMFLPGEMITSRKTHPPKNLLARVQNQLSVRLIRKRAGESEVNRRRVFTVRQPKIQRILGGIDDESMRGLLDDGEKLSSRSPRSLNSLLESSGDGGRTNAK